MRSLFTGRILILPAILILLVLLAWLILPFWAIRYVEKHDREWINRDITIDRLRINPFRFSATVTGVRVSEPDSAGTFLGFHRLYADLAPWPLFRSHLHVESLQLDSLRGRIVQAGSHFNFSDLLESGADTSATDSLPSADWTFELHDLKLNQGSILYEDRIVGSRLALDSVTLAIDSFASGDRSLEARFLFRQDRGGRLAGDLTYDLREGDYRLRSRIDSLALHPFMPYVTRGIRLNYFGGSLHADFSLSGNAEQSDYLAIRGAFDLEDFQLADPDNDTLVALGSVHVSIDTLNTRAQLYDFRHVLLEDTYTRFEYLPQGDNFSKLIVPAGAPAGTAPAAASDTLAINTSNYYASPFEYLALYIYDLTRDYIFTAYTADSVAIHNFNLKFYDYTLEDPFYMDVSRMTISAGEIAREDSVADFRFGGVLNRTGTMNGDVIVSREGAENMEVDFELKGLFLNGLSPYARYYTAHPLLEGAVTFTSVNQIENYFLTSSNRVFIERVRVGDKDKTGSGYSLPMKLAVVILRDIEGNIDLEIPIEGPLDDPDYKMGKVIWQVIKNIFVKAATAPFRLLANAFRVNEDDLKSIYFETGQRSLEGKQIKSLNAIAKVLSKKPELGIELLHLYNREYELDALALQKAKINYLRSDTAEAKTLPDSLWRLEAQDLPNTDSLFLRYLRQSVVSYDSTISIPENARLFYGEEALRAELQEVAREQKDLVSRFLTEVKGIAPSRFTIKDLSGEEIAINETRPRFKVQFAVEGDSGDASEGAEPEEAPPGG